jgi:replication factor C subunit 1
VITVTLESLDRDYATKLINQLRVVVCSFVFFALNVCWLLLQRYAGEVTKSVAKKCTHALVGQEPGESKVKKIEEMKLTVLDEDGLFELLRTLPAKKTTKAFEEKKAKIEKVATEGKEQPKEVVQAIRALPANQNSAVKEMWTTK